MAKLKQLIIAGKKVPVAQVDAFIGRVADELSKTFIDIPEGWPDHPEFGRRIPLSTAMNAIEGFKAQAALAALRDALGKVGKLKEEEDDGAPVPTQGKPTFYV